MTRFSSAARNSGNLLRNRRRARSASELSLKLHGSESDHAFPRCLRALRLFDVNRPLDCFFVLAARVVWGRRHECPILYELVDEVVRAADTRPFSNAAVPVSTRPPKSSPLSESLVDNSEDCIRKEVVAFLCSDSVGGAMLTITGLCRFPARRRFAAILLLLVSAAGMDAATITIDPGATYHAVAPGPCTGRGGSGPWEPCGADAYLYALAANWKETFVSPTTFNGGPGAWPTGETFKSAFDNWNDAHGDLWTLLNGGTLDIDFHVTLFQAVATQTNGGLNIRVYLDKYNPKPGDPTIDQLAWSQGLYVNYQPGVGHLGHPANTMDDYSMNQPGGSGAFGQPCVSLPLPLSGNNTTPSTIPESPKDAGGNYLAYCDPIYPFQYGVKDFYDPPRGAYPNDSFRAVALLSTVTFKTDGDLNILERDLTVYEGISYGFDLWVPEPSMALLVALALLLALMLRRRMGAPRRSGG